LASLPSWLVEEIELGWFAADVELVWQPVRAARLPTITVNARIVEVVVFIGRSNF
jgi:hypothetical protein